MMISFAGEKLDCRQKRVLAGQIKTQDIVQMPGGILVKCVTKQANCPIFESNTKTVTVYLFETETGVKFPARELSGEYTVLRRRK